MPKFEVTAPDGTKLEVVGPEGSTQEQAIAIAQKQYQPKGAEVPDEPPPSSNAFKEFGKGMASKVLDIAGSIADVATGRPLREDVSRLYNRLSGQPTDEPKGIGQENSQALDKKFGLEQAPDATLGQRIARGVGQSIVDPLSFAGAGSRLLQVGSAIATPAVSETLRTTAEAAGLPDWAQAGASVAGGLGTGAIAGSTSKALRQAAGRRALADNPAVKAASRASYKVIENDRTLIPVYFTDRLHSQILSSLGHKFDKMNAPETLGVLDFYLKDRAKPARFIDLVNMDERLGEINPNNGKDLYAGGLVKNEIRNWIGQASGKVGKAMKDAANDWRVQARVDDLRDMIEKGENQAAVTGVGHNTQNLQQQALNKILKNDKQLSMYKPDEQEAIKDGVRGTFLSQSNKMGGKMLPNSILFLVGAVSFPAAVGGKVATAAMREIGKYLTRQQIEHIISLVQEKATINKDQAIKNAAMRKDATQGLKGQTLRSGAMGANQAMENQGDAYDQLNEAQPQ